jgi:SAM-dependent methyltransferase
MAENGHSPDRLRFYLDYLFHNVELHGATMLDVGAGDGNYSFYAASAGAAKVVSLEPTQAGSSAGVAGTFERTAALLHLDKVQLVRERFQDYDPVDTKFDVLLLHASVNHLDEDACIHLHRDREAQKTYLTLFRKLAALSTPGAKLIVVDCSRRNLYPDLGLRNPFAPSIEWHKHQPPELWACLLSQVGFAKPEIRWNSFNRLGRVGRLLLGNRIAAYTLNSLFSLTMERTT